jgi:hypothetical protein
MPSSYSPQSKPPASPWAHSSESASCCVGWLESDVPKTADPLDVLAEIDQDLRAACLDRGKAYRRLRVKDNQNNRDAYEAACADVDELLDMRHEIAGAGQGSQA